MYKIIDKQFNYPKYFANGSVFKDKREVCEQLISYHSNDCDMEIAQELLGKGKIEECWNELSAFDWDLEKV